MGFDGSWSFGPAVTSETPETFGCELLTTSQLWSHAPVKSPSNKACTISFRKRSCVPNSVVYWDAQLWFKIYKLRCIIPSMWSYYLSNNLQRHGKNRWWNRILGHAASILGSNVFFLVVTPMLNVFYYKQLFLSSEQNFGFWGFAWSSGPFKPYKAASQGSDVQGSSFKRETKDQCREPCRIGYLMLCTCWSLLCFTT